MKILSIVLVSIFWNLSIVGIRIFLNLKKKDALFNFDKLDVDVSLLILIFLKPFLLLIAQFLKMNLLFFENLFFKQSKIFFCGSNA